MHYLFGISGFAGTGKDEFCKRLVLKHGALHTGLIDPGKRVLSEIYGFTEEQLFGASKHRNGGDIRYPKTTFFEESLIRTNIKNESGIYYWAKSSESYLDSSELILEGDPKYWLSPREALQQLGELLNTLYGDTWIDKGLATHKLVASGGYSYSRMGGIKKDKSVEKQDIFISCFSDFRHHNEIKATRALDSDCLKSVLVRIKTKRIPAPQHQHRSETEQLTIPDDSFDYVINNDGSIDQFHSMIDIIINDTLNSKPIQKPIILFPSGNISL